MFIRSFLRPLARLRSALRPAALLLGAFSLAPAAIHAQGFGAAAAARSQSYPLGPGDVLRLTVAGFPEYSQDSIIVPPDGIVSFARLGPIRLSGRTSGSVQSEIRQKLIARVRLRNPQVALIITQVRPEKSGSITLIGDVPRPGNFSIRETQRLRLSDLLAQAGLNERLEERRATLIRGGRATSLDLLAAATRPGAGADVRLQAGDSIAVSVVAAGKITVQGDVERPGVYELHRTPRAQDLELGLAPRLSDLLTRAGGLKSSEGSGAPIPPASGTGNSGAPRSPFAVGADEATGTGTGTGGTSKKAAVSSASYSATLQRDGAKRALDVEAATNDVSGAANIFLRAGDVISIRTVRPIAVYLNGAVTKPGLYELAPGAGVLQLLTLGGPLTRSPGDLRANIRRGDETIPLDLPELLISSSTGANVRLQNADTVQLNEPETLGVSVAGQVARPGTVKVRPGSTVLDALLAVGGVAPGTPLEGAHLDILRHESDGSQRVYHANAAGVLGYTDMTTNMLLREGDIINLERGAEQTVFVSGEVQNPGSFTINEGEGLAQIVARAGGPKEDARLASVRVTHRGGKEEVVNAFDAVRNGRPLDYKLKAGDIVNVPVNLDRVLAVGGSFAKPGYYSIPEGGKLTLLDFLGQAQPVTGVKQLYIFKVGADGTVDTREGARTSINLGDLSRGKQANITLSPRDVILADPPKGPKPSIFQVLGPLSLLGNLFR